MKLAICDDSYIDIKTLKQAVTEAATQLSLSIDADYYVSGEELLEHIKHVRDGEPYRLVFLDIYMQEMDGIETARKIREIIPDVQIAFITTSNEFVLDAFDLNALHYIIKPISVDKVSECLKRFNERKKLPPHMLNISSESRMYSFPLEHVQKIVSSRKGIDVFLTGLEPNHIPISLTNAEEQLDERYFLKISRGFIVHMSFILCIDKEVCRLKDGTEVLISRQMRQEIRKKYNDYLFLNM